MAINPVYLNFEINFRHIFENVLYSLRLHFKNIRDKSNPFELPEKKFIKLFRLNKEAAMQLVGQLQELVEETSRRDTVPFHLEADCDTLITLYIKFPITAEEVSVVKDGPSIPKFNRSYRLHAHSNSTPKVDDPINPAIFDSKLMITNVYARYPGAVHDAAIWESSNIQRHLRQKYVEGRRNCYLLGDSGYPLQPWLMTPVLDARPNTPEAMYNSLHTSTRNVVERGFGVWKARFRCLTKDRVLHYSHATSALIIYACAVLHNICRIFNVENEPDDDEDYDEIADNMNPERDIGNDILTEGRFVRQQLINQLSAFVDNR
nr:unnamed protein product [Callosobruchus analis]